MDKDFKLAENVMSMLFGTAFQNFAEKQIFTTKIFYPHENFLHFKNPPTFQRLVHQIKN